MIKKLKFCSYLPGLSAHSANAAMIKKWITAALYAGGLSLGLVSVAEAAFQGRLAATPGGSDYQAYYETTAGLTWVANANLLGSVRTWGAANEWAASLTVGGVSGWRLPSTIYGDTSCSVDVSTSTGFGCEGSEMGYLFNVLNISAASMGPFNSILATTYWSSTPIASNSAWMFDFNTGEQSHAGRNSPWRDMWAVQSGDISPVPVPAAAWLFGSGLIGLLGIAKRKKV